MDKRTLAAVIARDTDFRIWEVSEILNKEIKVIAEILCNGGEVSLNGLGHFKAKYHPERKGYNPVTKEKITLPERVSIKFVPSKKLTVSDEVLRQLAKEYKDE